MLFYINIGLSLLVLLNFKTCISYIAKYYIIGEIYVNDYIYKNRKQITYYNLENFKKINDCSENSIAKIEYEDKLKYLITDKKIDKNEIEQLIKSPKFFLSVELTHNNTTTDVTSEINMLIETKSYNFNPKTAQILMFIKDHSNIEEMNGPINWGIITNNAQMYNTDNTDNIILNIKGNNILNLKD